MITPPLRLRRRPPVVLPVLGLVTLFIGLCPPSAAAADSSGNIAGSAVASSGATAAGPVGAVNDGRGADSGDAWSLDPADPVAAVRLTWPSNRELTSVQLVGAPGFDDNIMAGTLTFSNGATIQVGQVLDDPRFPTTIAFGPKVVRWVRFEVTRASGPGRVGLGEVRAFPKGVTPLRPRNPDRSTLADDPVNPACLGSSPDVPAYGRVSVICPITNSRVSGTQPVAVVAPGLTEIDAAIWAGNSSSPTVSTTLDSGGRGVLSLPFDTVASGPVTVRLRGLSGPGLGGESTTYLQLYNASRPLGGTARLPRSQVAQGRTLVYDEEFETATSFSLDGRHPYADYSAAKTEFWGGDQFGGAIFPDPELGFDNLQVVDHRYLRITTQPNPAGFEDPNGWGRTSIGGMLSSARSGGSGFSAQFGYFEARMMVPATTGTWPAFWTMPSVSLIDEPAVDAEIDVLEHYGNDPRQTCHATHRYDSRGDTSQVRCGRRWNDVQQATSWHVYGAFVTATEVRYYIDDRLVLVLPQIVGGNQPLFFMINLTLGGGWPIELGTVQDRSALFVDYVRVYV